MTASSPPPLFDLGFLRDRRAQRRIAVVTLVCALAGGLYGWLGPKWYRSVLTVAPGKTQKSGGLSSLLGGELGSLAAGLDSSIGGGADVSRISAVLRSNVVSDAVIEKFDLRTRYRAKFAETARDALWQHCSLKTLPKPNLVELSCEDRDPRLVQEMLRYFAEYGNEVFRRVNVTSASEEVRFLEKRVAELKRQADESATRLRDFQEKHQIVDLESQAKAVVSSVATINSQRIARQMELDYARKFSSSDEAGTRQLESQISVLKDQLRDLEEPSETTSLPRAKAGSGAGMFPAATAVPKLRAEYEKIFRDRKVAEATLVLALDRLEGARAAEARDVSTFVVLDPPTLPTRKSRPKGLDFLLLGALLGVALGIAGEWVQAGRAARRVGSGSAA